MEFADRMRGINASEIREILKVTEQSDVISFAGGLPAPELFPAEDFNIASSQVLQRNGHEALQYTTTEGYAPLREKIAVRMNDKLGSHVSKDEILIVGGSQQGLDMTGKLFLNKGDTVICENPTYLGAINAFRAYECEFESVLTDEEGIQLEHLEKILKSSQRAKLIYVIPDFQNPTGVRWSVERREKFMKLVSQFDLPVIEDNPYGEVAFDNHVYPSLKKWDLQNQVVSLGTFSKILCPGLRVAWIAASEPIMQKYILLKQSADLHTSNHSQRAINQYLEMYDIEMHIQRIVDVYRSRRDLAISAIQNSFPEEIRYTYPEGGLFLWVELPEKLSSKDLLKRCIEENVAFVPGEAFYPNDDKKNTFRLNFSNASEDQLVEGIRKIGENIQQMLNSCQ